MMRWWLFSALIMLALANMCDHMASQCLPRTSPGKFLRTLNISPERAFLHSAESAQQETWSYEQTAVEMHRISKLLCIVGQMVREEGQPAPVVQAAALLGESSPYVYAAMLAAWLTPIAGWQHRFTPVALSPGQRVNNLQRTFRLLRPRLLILSTLRRQQRRILDEAFPTTVLAVIELGAPSVPRSIYPPGVRVLRLSDAIDAPCQIGARAAPNPSGASRGGMIRRLLCLHRDPTAPQRLLCYLIGP